MNEALLTCNGCSNSVILKGPGVHQTEAECGKCGYRMVREDA